MVLSQVFFQRLRDVGKPLYHIAWECGLSPNRVYKITSGVDRPKPDDPRIKSLCKYLNISIDEAFEPEDKSK